jgi:hypothetical protein
MMAIKHCADWADMRRVLTVDGCRFTGDSDTGISLFHRRLKMDYPEARVVMVWRDRDDSLADFTRHFGFEGDYSHAFDVSAAAWREMKSAWPDALTVDWKDLVAEGACKAVFDHCTRGELKWNSARWALLDALEINVLKSRVLSLKNPDITKEILWQS